MAPESHKPRIKPKSKTQPVEATDPVGDFFKRLFSGNNNGTQEPQYAGVINPKEKAKINAEKARMLRERARLQAREKARKTGVIIESRHDQYQITPEDRKIVDPIKAELKDGEGKVKKKEQVEVFQNVFEMAQVDGQFGYDTFGRYKINKLDRFLDIKDIINYGETFQKIEGYDLKFVLEKAKSMNEIFSGNAVFQGKSKEYFLLYFNVCKSFSQDQVKILQGNLPGIGTPDGDFGVYTFSKLLEKAKKESIPLEGILDFAQKLSLPPTPPEKPEELDSFIRVLKENGLSKELKQTYQEIISDSFYKDKLKTFAKKNNLTDAKNSDEFAAFITIAKKLQADKKEITASNVQQFLDSLKYDLPQIKVTVVNESPEQKRIKELQTILGINASGEIDEATKGAYNKEQSKFKTLFTVEEFFSLPNVELYKLTYLLKKQSNTPILDKNILDEILTDSQKYRLDGKGLLRFYSQELKIQELLEKTKFNEEELENIRLYIGVDKTKIPLNNEEVHKLMGKLNIVDFHLIELGELKKRILEITKIQITPVAQEYISENSNFQTIVAKDLRKVAGIGEKDEIVKISKGFKVTRADGTVLEVSEQDNNFSFIEGVYNLESAERIASLRASLGIGPNDKIEKTKKGFKISKTNGGSAEILKTDSNFQIIETLFSLENQVKFIKNKPSFITALKRLENIDKNVIIRLFGGKDMSEMYANFSQSPLSKIIPLDYISSFKKLSQDEISSFIKSPLVENIRLETDDLVLFDDEKHFILVYNEKKGKFVILNNIESSIFKEFQEYFNFNEFKKRLKGLKESQLRSFLSNLSIGEKPGKGSIDRNTIDYIKAYEVFKNNPVYADYGLNGIGLISSGRVIDTSKITDNDPILKKAGINKAFLQKLGVTGEKLIAYDEDTGVLYIDKESFSTEKILSLALKHDTEDGDFNNFIKILELLKGVYAQDIANFKDIVQKVVRGSPSLARQVLTKEENGEFSIHFKKNRFLMETITAFDLFNEVKLEYLKKGNTLYRRINNDFFEQKTAEDVKGMSWKNIKILGPLAERIISESGYLTIFGEKLDITTKDFNNPTKVSYPKQVEVDKENERVRQKVKFQDIIGVLEKMKTLAEKQAFLSVVKNIVSDSQLFYQVREYFTKPSEDKKGNRLEGVYSLDMQKLELYSPAIGLFELFGDVPSGTLKVQGTDIVYRKDTFSKQFVNAKGEILTLEKMAKLGKGSLIDTQALPVPDHYVLSDFFENEKLNIEKLEAFLRSSPKELGKIIDYFRNSLLNFADTDSLRKLVSTERRVENVLQYEIDFKNLTEVKKILTPYLLFSDKDYISINVGGKKQYYQNTGSTFVGLPNGNKLDNFSTNQLIVTEETEESIPEEFLALKGKFKIEGSFKGRERVTKIFLNGKEIRFPRFIREPNSKGKMMTWCSRTGLEFITEHLKLSLAHAPVSEDAFESFMRTNHLPKEGNIFRKKGGSMFVDKIYTQNDIEKFMKLNRSSVYMLYSDDSGKYKNKDGSTRVIGHVCPVVIDGDGVAWVLDAYYGGGKAYTLKDYIDLRGNRAMRGIISAKV